MVFSYALPIKNEEQYKRNLNTLDTENMGRKLHCLREAISLCHESTPNIVSKKNWNTGKGRQR